MLHPPVEHGIIPTNVWLVSVLVTEVPDSTYKEDGSDAQALRDSILKPPTDDVLSHKNDRSDQG